MTIIVIQYNLVFLLNCTFLLLVAEDQANQVADKIKCMFKKFFKRTIHYINIIKEV
jgi:hypothetical protein